LKNIKIKHALTICVHVFYSFCIFIEVKGNASYNG